MGLQGQVLNASTSREIDAIFESFVRERPDALFPEDLHSCRPPCPTGPPAAIHKVPATYPFRDFAEAGGLMSYGASLQDTIRQAGMHIGRI